MTLRLGTMSVKVVAEICSLSEVTIGRISEALQLQFKSDGAIRYRRKDIGSQAGNVYKRLFARMRICLPLNSEGDIKPDALRNPLVDCNESESMRGLE